MKYGDKGIVTHRVFRVWRFPGPPEWDDDYEYVGAEAKVVDAADSMWGPMWGPGSLKFKAKPKPPKFYNLESGSGLGAQRQSWGAGPWPGVPVPEDEFPSRQKDFELEPDGDYVRVRRFPLEHPSPGIVVGVTHLLEGQGGHDSDYEGGKSTWWKTQRRIPILQVAVPPRRRMEIINVVSVDLHVEEEAWQWLSPSSATA